MTDPAMEAVMEDLSDADVERQPGQGPLQQCRSSTLKDNAWAPFKEIIADMYGTRNISLRTVREHLARKYGFQAS